MTTQDVKWERECDQSTSRKREDADSGENVCLRPGGKRVAVANTLGTVATNESEKKLGTELNEL